MTKGSPFKLIIRFLIPIVLGNVIQQLYNLADSIIVGRFVGADALAAVGATGTIMFLIIGFMVGMTSGFSVVTAQRFGAGDEEGVRRSVCGAIILSAVVVLILTAGSLIGMRDLLTLMNTPDNVFDMSYIYIFTICAGLVFNALCNLTAGLLRAVGNSRIPLVFLTASAIINVALDLLFIITFNMGVFGAAFATIMSQALSGIACLIYIFTKTRVLSPRREDWAHAKDHMRLQFSIGIPMALQFSVTAIGTVIVQGALNTLGSVVMASYTASQKIEQLLTMPFQGMGAAMATYSGQNRGIADYGRIKKGVFQAALLTIGYGAVIAAILIPTPQYTIPLFVTEDLEEMIRWAKVYFSICPLFYIPLGLIFV
ncbi:MAG: MATE family efflux transporter, partial [Lachnospiraceae bacterium]|nr:MATE family efflux transporter [Lachnospiraceae bacterium]